MQENNKRISFRSQSAIDMNRRYENFRRSKNLSHLDFGRLMVSMYPGYDSHINVSRSIRSLLNGRTFSDRLVARMYNTISEFQTLRAINKVLGKKRTGYCISPVGCSIAKIQEKLSDSGTLGDHYLNRFIKKT